jgi:peptidoglycan glycosyltransferase
MHFNKYPKSLKLFVFFAISGFAVYALMGLSAPLDPEAAAHQKIQLQLDQRTAFAKHIGEQIRSNSFPSSIEITRDQDPERVNLEYTIDETLQAEASRLLKSYKPDYGAIFMIDATTGEVLAMSSYQRDNPEGANLNLQATFPAASVFKVVTATAAVDKAGVKPDHKIRYNGGAYTLYKKNVLSEKVNRWTNVITLRDAFARSINTAFGRLSIENLAPEDLTEYANRFMFNQEIPADFPVEIGVAYVPPGRGFEMAEVASGYNKTNRMSPVQGAMIAASVVNDGQLVVPYLVSKAQTEAGESIYEGSPLTNGSIMTKESAAQVRQLMQQTVVAGTSRTSFRPMVRDRKFREISMGGKTGHLTGDNPRGRVDWFVGYAQDSDRKIAIAAITVNKKFWTVKSAHLGQSMFRKYFGAIVSNNQSRIISATERH